MYGLRICMGYAFNNNGYTLYFRVLYYIKRRGFE